MLIHLARISVITIALALTATLGILLARPAPPTVITVVVPQTQAAAPTTVGGAGRAVAAASTVEAAEHALVSAVDHVVEDRPAALGEIDRLEDLYVDRVLDHAAVVSQRLVEIDDDRVLPLSRIELTVGACGHELVLPGLEAASLERGRHLVDDDELREPRFCDASRHHHEAQSQNSGTYGSTHVRTRPRRASDAIGSSATRSVCPTSASGSRCWARPNNVPVTPCTFALTDRDPTRNKKLQL
jgi:hypothetical protein